MPVSRVSAHYIRIYDRWQGNSCLFLVYRPDGTGPLLLLLTFDTQDFHPWVRAPLGHGGSMGTRRCIALIVPPANRFLIALVGRAGGRENWNEISRQVLTSSLWLNSFPGRLLID